MKALSSVASEGEQVWVKVISVNVDENENTKIGCSMKYVRQGDGEDLDPNNIQAEKQQSRPAWKEPQKVSTNLSLLRMSLSYRIYPCYLQILFLKLIFLLIFLSGGRVVGLC